jgi:molybdopterin-guanine dinucleotide biosynthesis protein A
LRRGACNLRDLKLLGAVLAGGESRRFGSDKAAERIGGTTLAARAAGTLARVFKDVVIVSSREPTTAEWPHVPDAREGCGPLAGIEAALLRARELRLDGAFILACDLPLVDEATVRAVVGALKSRLAAAPVREGEPGMEALCAPYRLECLPFVSRALDRGDLAVHALFQSVGGVTIRLPTGSFLNVNTPADHERATAVLRDAAG